MSKPLMYWNKVDCVSILARFALSTYLASGTARCHSSKIKLTEGLPIW
jgi:hypothetical protein